MLSRLIWRYVAGRYLKLLGSIFGASRLRQRLFFLRLRWDAGRISNRELEVLLEAGWRESLTASYLIAASRRAEHADRLGRLLLESESSLTHHSHCVALASIGTAAARDQLVSYLDRSPPDEHWFAPESAIPALVIVDRKLGSDAAARFLEPGGLWEIRVGKDRPIEEKVRSMSDLLALIGGSERGVE